MMSRPEPRMSTGSPQDAESELTEVDRLLTSLREIDAPSGASERIVLAVSRDARRSRQLSALTLAAFFGLLAALSVSLSVLTSQLRLSPAGDLARLAFADGGQVGAHLADWGMAVLEALPFETIWLVLALLFGTLLVGYRLLRSLDARLPHTTQTHPTQTISSAL